MRNLSGSFKERLARKDLTLCRLLELTLKNGSVFRYTDTSSNVSFGGAVYYAKPGIQVSNVRSSISGGVENASVQIGYDVDARLLLTEDLVRGGAVDDAGYKLTVVDYKSLGSGGMVIFEGQVQNVNASDKSTCTLDVGGFSTQSYVLIGENYSQRCRNILGDKRCKVDVDALAKDFAVLTVAQSGYEFNINAQTDIEIVERPAKSEAGEQLFPVGTTEFPVPDYDILELELNAGSGGGGSSLLGAIVDPGHAFDRTAPGYPGSQGGDTSVTIKAGGRVLALAPGGQGGQGGTLDRPNGPGKRSQAIGYPPPGKASGQFNYDGVAGGLGADRSLVLIGLGSFRGGDADNGTRTLVKIQATDEGAPVKGDILVFKCGAAGKAEKSQALPAILGRDGQPGGAKVKWSYNSALELARFDRGTILWLTGLNAGTVSSIDVNDDFVIKLAEFPNFAVQPGDTGRFRPGCTNYADYCENVFKNLKNMQAEPAVPQGVGSAPVPTTTVIPDANKPPDVINTPVGSSETGNGYYPVRPYGASLAAG